jgi:hypothetical protein
VILIVIRQINVHRNKQKEKLTTAQGYTKVVNGEFLDMTDMENPGTSLFPTFLTFRVPIYSLIVNSRECVLQ